LPPSAVLLAHNGSRFDAPLVYLEMRRARIPAAHLDKLGLTFADTFLLFAKVRRFLEAHVGIMHVLYLPCVK
jgi:hypothetical protein